MRIYIIGAAGMLGAYLVPYLRSKGHLVMATDIQMGDDYVTKYTDVRDFHTLQTDVATYDPDVIINLAAMTDLEICERMVEAAMRTNADGSRYCAQLAIQRDIHYVYISTAGIFDGKAEYYEDWSQPNPLGVYAKSKYDGELAAQTVPKHIVMRCGWQMGSCEKDKKFIGKIMQQLRTGATELHAVFDKAGTPTYVKDFSLQMEQLLAGQFYGVFNVVCQGEATRWDVAVELVRLLGLQNHVPVHRVGSDFYSRAYWAKRPASEKLQTSRLNTLGINVMRPWQVALAEYVRTYPTFFTVSKPSAE